MQIRYGYEIEVACQNATPLIAMIDLHPAFHGRIVSAGGVLARSLVTGENLGGMRLYYDHFGNLCRRIVAPPGGLVLSAQGIALDSGRPDPLQADAQAVAPDSLPDDVLVFLLGSRYCETDVLSQFAWNKFGHISSGWQKVQAVCDFVHHHLRFDYQLARNTRSAAEGLAEKVGVCRDFAHLAITLCRSLNIPARYCTGYLGDIGVPEVPFPMDFSAWFEAFLGGKWWTFDARHNVPRIGRLLMARGRDATDVPIINSFGAHSLRRFEVITEEVETDSPAMLGTMPCGAGQDQRQNSTAPGP